MLLLMLVFVLGGGGVGRVGGRLGVSCGGLWTWLLQTREGSVGQMVTEEGEKEIQELELGARF